MKNFLFLLLVTFSLINCSPTKKYTASVQHWEKDMQKFDSLNAVNDYADNAILFAGSSSIRIWKNIEQDMAPYPVIQRGYGGASFTDLAYYIERIVYPHQFKALVVFAGNDIWGKETDRNPAEITRLMEHIVKRVGKKYGTTPIFVIEVTHVPVRGHLVAEIEAENQALKAVCDKYAHVHWIPTKQIYLTPEGKVNTALFGKDNTHQNPEGYQLWTEAIKKKVKEVL